MGIGMYVLRDDSRRNCGIKEQEKHAPRKGQEGQGGMGRWAVVLAASPFLLKSLHPSPLLFYPLTAVVCIAVL